MTEQPSKARPAGSRRFWWTVLAFAAVNAAVVATVLFPRLFTPQAASGAAGGVALTVQNFAPGEGGVVAPRGVLTWTFNADVVSAPGPAPDAPGTLAPAVPGNWRWVDTKTLEFHAEADFPRATPISVTLSPHRLRTPDGRTLESPFVSAVRTRPLELLAARPLGRLDGQPILELVFNDAVDLDLAINHLSVSDANGEKLVAQPHGASGDRTLRVRCGLADGSACPGEMDLRVTLKKGLVGKAGPLGLSADMTVPVSVSATLMATELSADAPAGGDAHIIVRFNQPPDLDKLRKVLAVEPAVPFTIARQYGSTIGLNGPFRPGTPYLVRINTAPAGSDNGFPKPTALSVFIPDRPSVAWLDYDQGYLGAQGNRAVMAHAVNVPAVRVSVTRVYDDNLVSWRNAGAADGDRYSYRRYPTQQGVARFARPITTRRIELPDKRNAVHDLRLALDELLPSGTGGDGVYRVSVAAEGVNAPVMPIDADGAAYDLTSGHAAAVVTLSDIGLSAKQGPGGVSAWAVSLSAGKPIEQVRLRLYSNKSQLLAEATTDASGLATLANLRPAPGETPAVLIADRAAADHGARAGLTWLDLRGGPAAFGQADTGGRPYLRDGYEAFVYTDRGVYRPGETAHLRAIVRGGANETPGTFPLKWQLRRPDFREWKSDVAPLDADGAAGLTLNLPSDLPTGRWTAQVGLPGPGGKGLGAVFGSVTFQVEDYIPQRIAVNASVRSQEREIAPAGRLAVRDPATIQLQADYLLGKPAAGLAATGTLHIAPAVFAPASWRGWTFGDSARVATVGDKPPETARQIDLKPTTLDDAGHSQWLIDGAALTTPRGGKGEPSRFNGPWRITAALSVSESGGRAVSTARVFEVDKLERYIGVKAPKNPPRVRLPVSFAIAMVNADGSPSTVDGTVQAALFRRGMEYDPHARGWPVPLSKQPSAAAGASAAGPEAAGRCRPGGVHSASGRAICAGCHQRSRGRNDAGVRCRRHSMERQHQPSRPGKNRADPVAGQGCRGVGPIAG